ncbi:beta-lactamase family protein [Protaetiibacter sp. SSC-01]|uniref:serine hydrolase domain-containing protein n=1 Tax=Protaetiibacter sp. SSC-01 TaxID=2759943 RepID=UPI001656BF63|nr:serine hydrolase domain-containing protein [Protaetiibacter sp. SSC-01]QNO37544.1 beta-lactamase family protein [Protaetiibacter sp. SSC-01]
MTSTARLQEALARGLDARVGVTAPAQVRGVFAGGALEAVVASGDLPVAAERTAFRIASCTKSFTAATALLLEADGLLDLDEPLADALDVPLRILGPDARQPTVLDALAMRAGFPTDDPWADRQESLPHDVFAALLGEGVRAIWPAGERFEYSNLGYAIVGRIVAARAGMPFRRVVESRLLEPLGLTGTGFDESVGGVVTGYRPGADSGRDARTQTWEPLPFSTPGAFSPIGGLFSTATDLARWCGVLSGAIDAGAVLPAGLVERMRHPQTPIAGDPAGGGVWSAYGLGLTLRGDSFGRVFVGHSGGYPGFTTRMQWEQGSGVGAVVFENATYTALTPAVDAVFDDAFGVTDAMPAAPEPPAFAPWPETVAAASALRTSLVEGSLGDPAMFDACVDLDVPFARREASLRALLADVGGVTDAGPLTHESPAHATWELRGPRGALRCRLLMTPHAAPVVQKLDVVAAD